MNDGPHPLRNTTAGRLALVFVGVILFFIVFSVVTGEPSETCRWCSPNAFDDAIRRWLVANDGHGPGTLSHVFSIGVLPIVAIAATVVPGTLTPARRRYGLQDFAIIIVAFLLTTAITDGIKKLVVRERPGFHYGRELLIEAAKSPLERNLSFFSGDTAWAFTFAACAFAIAGLRGYRSARWTGVVGFTLAVIAGILRIVADMHWATDVVAGATVGTLVGLGLPRILHPRAPIEPGAD